MGAWSLAWSRRNERSLRVVAEYRPTGMFTRPKVRAPFQIGRMPAHRRRRRNGLHTWSGRFTSGRAKPAAVGDEAVDGRQGRGKGQTGLDGAHGDADQTSERHAREHEPYREAAGDDGI